MRENWRVYAKFAVLALMFPAFWLAQCAIDRYVEPPSLEERMIAAVCRGDGPEMENALRNRACTRWRDAQGLTLLSYAAQQGDARIARRFLDAGADANHADNNGMTPLMWAVQGDHLDVARLLIERGANAALRDNCGETARQQAQRRESAEMIDLLRDAEQAQICLNSNG